MTLISTNVATMEAEETKQRLGPTDGYTGVNDTHIVMINGEDNEQDAEDSKSRSPRRERRISEKAGDRESSDLPILMVQAATPLPHPLTPDINNNENENDNLLKSTPGDAVKEEDDDDAEDMSDDDGGEEEEVEEEEEEPEMTPEEKKDMHECVKSGDIDSLEDCLDLPGSDINMTWFRENLLMTAIRYEQQEMAEFLLDNGVDHTYTTSIVGMRETAKGKALERYQLTCRQMAYDKEMFDIVDLIDSLQGQLFPFIRLPERMPRFRRPRPPTPSESETGSDESSEGADVSSEGEKEEDESKEARSEDRERKQHRTKKRKKKKKEEGAEDVDGKHAEVAQGREDEGEDEGEKDKTFGGCSSVDVDSGHHSLASGKLKKALLKEHNRLMEKEEKEEEEREKREGSHEGSSSHRRNLRKSKNSANSSDAKEKSGSMKSRTHSNGKSEALKEDEGSGGEDHDRTHDEGYGGSASLHSRVPGQTPQPSPSPEPIKPWNAAPKNRIRSTKSALTGRRSVNLRFGRRVLSGGSLPPRYSQSGYSSSIPLDFEESDEKDISNEPLSWKKVSTAGSYARESKHWHHAQPSGSQEASNTSPDASVEISQIKFGYSPNHFSAVTPALSTKSSTTKARVLPKSVTKLSSSPATASTTSSGFDHLSSSAAATTTATATSHRELSSTSRPQVAGYMRATRSTSSKCRLTPRFTCRYGGLDFQQVKAKASSTNYSRASVTSASSSSASGSQSSENIRLALGTNNSSPGFSDGPVAPRVPSKKLTIPVLSSAVSKHQKRNHSAISFRS